MAVLAPVSWRVPPRAYGPWEQFASLLTEGLVERGVDVTLFATADSLTSAKLDSVVGRGYSEDPGACQTSPVDWGLVASSCLRECRLGAWRRA